jgi:hypothetical protein
MQSIRHWLRARLRHALAVRRRVRGVDVTVYNTRPDVDSGQVLERLAAALDLIDRYTPHYGRHLRRDFSGFLVQRYPCRGAYFLETRQCLVELTFCVHPAISEPEIAATILHEAMHARLHALGFPVEMQDRARQERFCRRAEIEFGRLVPGGEPVVARALQTLQLEDAEVAPEIDWQIAQQRMDQADRDASAS